MKISGIIPLRNAVKLGYPFELAIRSLDRLCDEIVILADQTSDDDTLKRVVALSVEINNFWAHPLCRIIESPWDTANHQGHINCEISVQTRMACEAATGDWILSLQADELLHEDDIDPLRKVIEIADRSGITGIELERLYFYGSLEKVRTDWTQWLVRLFKRGKWKPDVDGAMKFEPIGQQTRMRTEAAKMFHYSRVGDPALIAERVRNLDKFFHAPQSVEAGELEPYDFGQLRKLDSYKIGHVAETDPNARLMSFPLGCHPRMAIEHFEGVGKCG